jgi:hypothetical protein
LIRIPQTAANAQYFLLRATTARGYKANYVSIYGEGYIIANYRAFRRQIIVRMQYKAAVYFFGATEIRI